MTIYINKGKEGKPDSLALKEERLDDKDAIHLTEMLWSLTDTKISIIGLLGDKTVGVEDYNDKSFQPTGKKVAFSFLRDENPVYDKETKKTNIEPASREQKVRFTILHTALKKLQEVDKAVCASAVMKPNISALVAGAAEATDEEAKQAFNFYTRGMFIFTPCSPEKLTGEDTDFINTLVNTKPGEFKKSGGGWNSTPKETEAEKLAARWAFIQTHFEVELDFKPLSMSQLLGLIDAQLEKDKVYHREALTLLIQLMTK